MDGKRVTGEQDIRQRDRLIFSEHDAAGLKSCIPKRRMESR
jgi:hypothetical protein